MPRRRRATPAEEALLSGASASAMSLDATTLNDGPPISDRIMLSESVMRDIEERHRRRDTIRVDRGVNEDSWGYSGDWMNRIHDQRGTTPVVAELCAKDVRMFEGLIAREVRTGIREEVSKAVANEIKPLKEPVDLFRLGETSARKKIIGILRKTKRQQRNTLVSACLDLVMTEIAGLWPSFTQDYMAAEAVADVHQRGGSQ
jgi:hypothetical protein